jgi:hypothetical protein
MIRAKRVENTYVDADFARTSSGFAIKPRGIRIHFASSFVDERNRSLDILVEHALTAIFLTEVNLA